MKVLHTCIVLIFLGSFNLVAQEEEDLSALDFNGYVSGIPSVNWTSDSALWQVLLHNRLNFHWYPTPSLQASLQFRNQFIAGDFIELMGVEDGFKQENYALPLTYYQIFGNDYLLSLSIDRLWVQYTHNKLEIKLGRQRINWGQTFVWNPNDIFNTYNFFEFDYPERPGADAVRVIYYPNYNSSVDLAAKTDSAGNITAAGMYRFTKWNTEIQLLGGYYSQSNRLMTDPFSPPLTWDDRDLYTDSAFREAWGV